MNFQKQTFRTLFFLFLLTCLLSGLVGIVRVPAKAAPQLIYPAISVVISEFRTTGPNGANDEFIELYNPTGSSISIGNWQLKVLTGGGAEATRGPAIPAGTTLSSGQHFLIANNTAITGYSGLATPDLTYATGIVDAGGIAIFDNSNIKVDSVGLNTTTATYTEGSPLTTMTGSPANQSYERRIGGANGNCQDDGNNLLDFIYHDGTVGNTSDPQNFTTSPIVLCGVPTATPVPVIEVVINEVAWAGTQAFSGDEWIELYNATGASIDLTNWRLEAADGDPTINLSGLTIPATGYLLLERGSPNVTNVPASGSVNIATYFSGLLNNSGEILYLLNGSSQIVDTANSNGGGWPAGGSSSPFPSMERTVIAPDSDFTWVTFVGTPTATDATGLGIYGTPGSANSQPGVTPTFTLTPTLTSTATTTPTFTATTTPTQTLTPTATTTALTPATNIVISEFRTVGPNGGNDEFIELYNPTISAVSIGNWEIRRSTGCGATTARITLIPPTVTLAAGQHYLIRGSNYSDSVSADLSADLGIANDGGIALLNSSGAIIDQVGLCSSTAYKEGTALASLTTNVNRGYDRKSSSSGVCVDSNNNNVDFILRSPSDPQNSSSPLTRCGNPTPTPTATPPRTATPRPSPTPTLPPPPPPPLVAINEFVPRPGHDWNNDGVINIGDEYIEIINHGVIDVNLGGYSLDDEANIGSAPYPLPSEILKPGERIVFYGKETGLLLSDGGDGVRLLKPNGQLGDAYNYTVVKYPDQAYCRLPDNGGLDDWNQNCFPTPGLKNTLSGSFARPPTEEDDDQPLCPIADTLPIDFVWAECPSFGNIWSRFYWDAKGWFGEKALPDVNGKWDVYVD